MLALTAEARVIPMAHPPVLLEGFTMRPPVLERFECKYCLDAFSTALALTNHLMRHHVSCTGHHLQPLPSMGKGEWPETTPFITRMVRYYRMGLTGWQQLLHHVEMRLGVIIFCVVLLFSLWLYGEPSKALVLRR